MIIYLVVQSFLGFFYVLIGHFLPVVTSLPFGIDTYLTQGMHYIYFIASVFPPMHTLLNGFYWVLGFELILLVIRLIPWVRHLVTKN